MGRIVAKPALMTAAEGGRCRQGRGTGSLVSHVDGSERQDLPTALKFLI